MTFLKRRKWTLISFFFVVQVGFFCKFYSGPVDFWVNDSLAGLFYEIFWCLLIFLLFQKMKPFNIALIVFVITCILEFLQLWHPPLLEFFRSFFAGRSILGTSFTWSDFIYYFIGCSISIFWMNFLKHTERN
jgi:hypothetical protein